MHTYIQTMLLQCQRCGYQWDYKGNADWYTSCPRCRTSVKVQRRRERKSTR